MTDKRERILIATERLIARCGLEHTSMKRVAEEANVAAGTIYRYFADKDDLLYQLHVRLSHLAAASFFQGIEEAIGLFERFRRIWLNMYDYQRRYPQRLQVKEQLDAAPRSEEAHQASLQLFQPLTDLLAKGVAEGVFKRLRPELLFSLAFGPTLYIHRLKACQPGMLTQHEKETLILACWDAILMHH